MPAYYLACATERFGPSDLLEQAVEGERAYFDGICGIEPGPAWAWLDAAGQTTEYLRLGFAVTTPVDVDALATLTARFPGRSFLAVGSPTAELGQLEEMVELIGRHFAGEWRRPPVHVLGFDEGAAQVAGRLGDGLWTRADPEQAPALIEAYHEGCAEGGKEVGEILLQAPFSWGETREQALDGTPGSQTTPQPPEHTQATLLRTFIASTEADEHVERILEIERLGATAVVLANVSAEPLEAVRVYGRDVLPKLRG